MAGALAPGTGEFALIDSRGGRYRDWKVGMTGWFFLLEGDLRTAEVLEREFEVEMLMIETPELQILVSIDD